jgi:hypothetical protein
MRSILTRQPTPSTPNGSSRSRIQSACPGLKQRLVRRIVGNLRYLMKMSRDRHLHRTLPTVRIGTTKVGGVENLLLAANLPDRAELRVLAVMRASVRWKCTKGASATIACITNSGSASSTFSEPVKE